MHWNRRSFLGLSAATGLIKVLPAAAQALPSGKQEGNVVSALDFGADPTGTKDSTAAMRKAISKLAAEGAVLDLPKGTYRFDASKETAMSLKGLRNVEIRGNGSSLLFAGGTQPFNVDDCAGFRLATATVLAGHSATYRAKVVRDRYRPGVPRQRQRRGAGHQRL